MQTTLAPKFLSREDKIAAGVVLREDLAGDLPSSMPLLGGGRLDTVAQAEAQVKPTFLYQQDAPSCHDCGSIMVRNGSCYKCLDCGSTSGCS